MKYWGRAGVTRLRVIWNQMEMEYVDVDAETLPSPLKCVVSSKDNRCQTSCCENFRKTYPGYLYFELHITFSLFIVSDFLVLTENFGMIRHVRLRPKL